MSLATPDARVICSFTGVNWSFRVNMSKDDELVDLKYKIKEENPDMVPGGAGRLGLYLGDIEIGDDDTRDTIKLKIDAKMETNPDPLDDHKTLDALFPQGLVPRRIHIIVVIPEAPPRMRSSPRSQDC